MMRTNSLRAHLLVAFSGLLLAAGCGDGAVASGRPGEVTNGDGAADSGGGGGDDGSVTADGGQDDAAPADLDGGAAGAGGGGGTTGAGGTGGAAQSGQLAVTVHAKDDGITEANITKPRISVENSGTVTLTGFEVRYYFTVTEAATPTIDVYYSPEATLALVHDAGSRWYVSATYQRALAPGEKTEAGDGLTYGLHFTSWAVWDKSDDESHQGLTGTMAETQQIDVLDAQHVRICGTIVP